MNSEKIEGIGSIWGGDYDTISIEGIGKIKANCTAKNVSVEGLLKIKGTLTTDKMNIEGVARAFRKIKAKILNIEGVLKLRRASLYADHITCEGIIVCNREISADSIDLFGLCSASKIYGDTVTIKKSSDKINMSCANQYWVLKLGKLYLGRKMPMNYNLVDIIECTSLHASALKSNIIKANHVTLTDHCVVDKLYCDGEINIDDTCIVNKIYSSFSKEEKQYTNEMRETSHHGNEDKVKHQLNEYRNMNHPQVMKIIKLYEDKMITFEETEKMIDAVNNKN